MLRRLAIQFMFLAMVMSAAFAGDKMSDLKSFEQLKNDFNTQVGKVRIVTLLSPT